MIRSATLMMAFLLSTTAFAAETCTDFSGKYQKSGASRWDLIIKQTGCESIELDRYEGNGTTYYADAPVELTFDGRTHLGFSGNWSFNIISFWRAKEFVYEMSDYTHDGSDLVSTTIFSLDAQGRLIENMSTYSFSTGKDVGEPVVNTYTKVN